MAASACWSATDAITACVQAQDLSGTSVQPGAPAKTFRGGHARDAGADDAAGGPPGGRACTSFPARGGDAGPGSELALHWTRIGLTLHGRRRLRWGMASPDTSGGPVPRLYHAPSSYYSMVARLALAEAGIAHEQVFVDIHVRAAQQSPAYARLNPNLTVPTLVWPGRVLDQSRDILEAALPATGRGRDAEVAEWLDLHYAFPIEELTFGRLLARHPAARVLVPRRLGAARRHLLRLADTNPDLREIYERRAAVFAERERTFDPATATRLAALRSGQAVDLLDRLEHRLAAPCDVLVPPDHGAADVVWTVFLARMHFIGMGDEVAACPALVRYWQAMAARPAFAAADVWTRLHAGRLLRGILHGARRRPAEAASRRPA